MSKRVTTSYNAQFKVHAVKLAVESNQPISATADELDHPPSTLHTKVTQYHPVETKAKSQLND